MPINNWWDGDPREIYWMEITNRVDLGADLRAPKRDFAGNESWSYNLTSYVRPGDRVFHWHKNSAGEPAIVGYSEAGGPLQTIQMTWQARGTRGRERGVPTEGDAWLVPLDGFVAIDPPITRSMINERRQEILSTLQDVASIHDGPIYAPFQNYGGRELRAQQGYLTKFPAALVDLMFAEHSDVSRPAAAPPNPRLGAGQGYLADAAMRSAIELHAVELAKGYYRSVGATEIEELGKPYDLRVTLRGEERHVEVKGSVGISLETVQVTQGEVDHARQWLLTDLVVVDGIALKRGPDHSIETSGGNLRIWENWVPSSTDLRPTHLRYTLPMLNKPGVSKNL